MPLLVRAESGLSQLGDSLAHVWQGLRKLQQAIKFLPVASGDMVRVIEILPSKEQTRTGASAGTNAGVRSISETVKEI